MMWLMMLVVLMANVSPESQEGDRFLVLPADAVYDANVNMEEMIMQSLFQLFLNDENFSYNITNSSFGNISFTISSLY